MLTINQFREKYPVYNDKSDRQLVDALHTKFYQNIPKDEFTRRFIVGDKAISKDVLPEPIPLKQFTFGSTRIPGSYEPLTLDEKRVEMGIPIEKDISPESVGEIVSEAAKPFVAAISAPITIPSNIIVGLIKDVKGGSSTENVNAIRRILALNPAKGDELFVGDILKEIGITDESLDLPEGTVDKIGLIGDVSAFGGVAKLNKVISKTITSKNPAQTFIKEMGGKEKISGIVEQGKETFKSIAKPKKLDILKSEAGFARLGQETEPVFTGKAAEVWKVMKEARELSDKQHSLTFKKVRETMKRSFVDVSGNIKNKLLKQGGIEGKKVIIERDLIAGSHAHAIRMERIAENKIYGKMSQLERNHLDAFIEAKRNIEIAKNKPNFKFPKKLDKSNYEDVIRQIPQEMKSRIEKSAKEYWAIMDDQIQQLKTEGLLTEEALKALRKSGENYSPRRVLEWIDPGSTNQFGGKLISVPNSGLKKLSEIGTEKLVENRSAVLLSEVINRTQSRIFRNRANVALYDLAKNVPDNNIAKLAKVIKKTKSGKPVLEKTPAGHERIGVMIDGVEKTMFMPNEMAKEWLVRDPMINSSLANMVSWVSGSKILRTFATGINPEFAFTNFFRDAAHIWLTTQEYSKLLPKAGIQMLSDIKYVMNDAIKRKGLWDDYVREGGGMEFLTHQGRLAKRKGGLFGTFQDYLAWTGETSEIVTRLALKRRAMINGASSKESTWIARNYLDFAQGGSMAKAVDSGVPYLNAAIQGTRGIFRAASQNPKEFGIKISQISTLAGGLYFANKYQNPEAWKQISHREKVNNWIFTTPFSYKDKNGEKRYVYFKIAKDQGQRFFATVMENAMAKLTGEEIDTDQVLQSVHDFFPTVPTELMPPTMESLMGYVSNRDFWKREDIWKQTEPLPFPDSKVEYHKYTHPAFTTIGDKTGLSPERLEFALSQIFTRGNIYTSLVGHAWNNIIKDMPENEKERVTEEIILKQPFIRRIVRNTDPFFEQEKKLKKEKTRSVVDRLNQNRSFDKISQDFYDGNKTRKEVMDIIFKSPVEDRRRLFQRHKRLGKLQGLQEMRWWMSIADLPPEIRANVYWNRLRDTKNEEEKNRLEMDLRKVPGIMSKRFMAKLNKLKHHAK